MNDEKGGSALIYKCQNYFKKKNLSTKINNSFLDWILLYFFKLNLKKKKNQREVLGQLYCPFLCTIEYSP